MVGRGTHVWLSTGISDGTHICVPRERETIKERKRARARSRVCVCVCVRERERVDADPLQRRARR